MNSNIDVYNQHNLDTTKKYNTCPICSHKRSVKNQKQRCLMTNWERGIATCQHCRNIIQLHKYKYNKNDFLYYVPEPKKANSEGSYHSIEFFDEVTFKYNDHNNFSKYLENFFSRKQIFEAEQKLMIFSTNDFYQKSICYPYINEKEEITGVKVMAYDEKGNRKKNKEGNGIVSWMHSIYKVENWKNNFCLFGLHQILDRNEKIIHIVESEKTAFVMTIAKPEFIWIATGGLTMLNRNKLEPLRGYKIILHPDKGKAFISWGNLAKELSDFNIKIASITELNPHIEDNGDLADYYLKKTSINADNKF